MDLAVKLTVLFFGFCSGLFYRTRQFHYIDVCLSWADARQYCREHYTDLGGANSMNQIQQLNRSALKTPMVWIGLSDLQDSWANGMAGDLVSWRWSATELPSETSYTNWESGEPDNDKLEYCVVLGKGGGWRDKPCSTFRSFVCYDDRSQSYVFGLIPMPWWAAQGYCRLFHTDLATISSSADNDRAKAVIPIFFEGWIGLYRVPWSWSDENENDFTNWIPGQPDNDNNQYCVAEDESHQWDDEDCDIQNAFLCHEDFKSGAVQMKMKTTADMKDAAVKLKLLQKLKVVLNQWGWAEVVVQWRLQPTKDKTLLLLP